MRRSLRAAAVGLLPVVTLAACTSPENDRLMLGPETLEPVALTGLSPTVDVGLEPPADDEPTLLGTSRANWSTQVFVVPVDTIVHAPTWVWFNGYPGDTSRDTGVFPTALTALDGPHDQGNLRAAEAAAGATWGLVEAIAFPVRLFIDPPMDDRRSPTRRYERTPGSGS